MADVASDPGRPLRFALVDALRASRTVRSDAVATGMATVPREHYVPPGTSLADAYADRPLVLTSDAEGQATSTISQPSMVALMLEQLGLSPGHHVLEIGTASGYNAALLAHLTGPTGTVTSVELDPELAAAARTRLAGTAPPIRVIAGDGWLGAPDASPFDRIVVTVGVHDLSPAWVDQLRDGGILVAPVTLRPGLEVSLALVRRGGELHSASVHLCGFVRLRGPHAHTPRARVPLGGGAALLGELPPGSTEGVRAALGAGPVDAGRVGRLREGWAVQLPLDAAHPLVLTTGESGPGVHLGLYDPEGRGVAVVDGDRIASFGDAGAVRLLRHHLRTAGPVRAADLRVTARPAGATPPPCRWTVRTPHHVFGIDRG